jgi:hypothetical protein
MSSLTQISSASGPRAPIGSSGSAAERAARIYDGADEVRKTTLGRRILRRYANS